VARPLLLGGATAEAALAVGGEVIACRSQYKRSQKQP
jgi:hypothetical protein